MSKDISDILNELEKVDYFKTNKYNFSSWMDSNPRSIYETRYWRIELSKRQFNFKEVEESVYRLISYMDSNGYSLENNITREFAKEYCPKWGYFQYKSDKRHSLVIKKGRPKDEDFIGHPCTFDTATYAMELFEHGKWHLDTLLKHPESTFYGNLYLIFKLNN